MTKETITKNYINEMKNIFSDKKPEKVKILITGVSINNLGETIGDSFPVNYETLKPPKELLDVRNKDNIKKYFQENKDLTHMICCHGYTHIDWIENQPDECIEDDININLLGNIFLVKEFIKSTINNPYKKQIIIIGSMAYNHVLNASAPYCAAKAGLNHFVECAAWELAPKGYDIYIINPCNIENTPMTEKSIEGIMRYREIDRAAAEAYWGAVAIRKNWLQKVDIARIVNFLIEEPSGYLSGSHIDLKGGQR